MNGIYRPLVFLGMLLLSAICAMAQPRIRVVEGKTYDWGHVQPGVMNAKLHVTNVGSGTLEITQVAATCGCTTAPINKTKIVAGDTALLDVTIDMRTREGDQLKQVILVSNDTAEPSVTIDFTASIERDLVIEPTTFPSVVNMVKGKEIHTSVEIKNKGTDTIHIREPWLVATGVRGRFVIEPTRDLKPGETAKLTAYLTGLDEGFAIGYVAIPSTSLSVPEAQVQLICQVKAESGSEAAK